MPNVSVHLWNRNVWPHRSGLHINTRSGNHSGANVFRMCVLENCENSANSDATPTRPRTEHAREANLAHTQMMVSPYTKKTMKMVSKERGDTYRTAVLYAIAFVVASNAPGSGLHMLLCTRNCVVNLVHYMVNALVVIGWYVYTYV